MVKAFGKYFIAQQYHPDYSKKTGFIYLNCTPDMVYVADGEGGEKPVKSLKHQPDLGVYEIISIKNEPGVKDGDFVLVHKYVSANRFYFDGKEYVRILKKHIELLLNKHPDELSIYSTLPEHEDARLREDDKFRLEMQERNETYDRWESGAKSYRLRPRRFK